MEDLPMQAAVLDDSNQAAETPDEPAPSKRTSAQKVAIVLGALVLAGGLTAGGIYLATHHDQPTTIISNTGTTISLVDGKNKITTGGTYTFTGSTNDGKITVDTADEVRLILNGVSITNPSGATIKCKGTGKVTIELVGENTLISTDNTTDPAGAISSDADLEITGTGSAKLQSNGKGIKADGLLTLTSGTFIIEAQDDTIHSNGSVVIADGSYTLSTGDDGVHADSNLTINGGTINITKSYEGLEAEVLEINAGDISIIASDDGINAASGSDDSAAFGHPGSMASSTAKLTINGGKIYVNAAGDGIDSNGSIYLNGGEVYVDGPTNSADGALDYDGAMEITGGTIIAVGASGMAMNASSATQPAVLINLSGNYSGEFSFGGLSYTPQKSYQSIMISSDQLTVGETHDLVINGNTVQSVTITANITGGGMMGGFGGDPGMEGGAQGGGFNGGGRMMPR